MTILQRLGPLGIPEHPLNCAMNRLRLGYVKEEEEEAYVFDDLEDVVSRSMLQTSFDMSQFDF